MHTYNNRILIYTYIHKYKQLQLKKKMLSQEALQKQHQLMNLARNKLVNCVNMETQNKQYELRKLVGHANLYDKLSVSIITNNNLIKQQYLQQVEKKQQRPQPRLIQCTYGSNSRISSNDDADNEWQSLSDSDSDWDSLSDSDSDSDYEYEYDFGEDIDNVPRHCKIDQDLSLLPSVSHKEYSSVQLSV